MIRTLVSVLFGLFFWIMPPKENNAIKKLELLYSNLGFSSDFVKIRFWDAPIEQVEKLVPKKSTVVELGCGEGLCSNYLALTSNNRSIYGVDIDANRVKLAFRGLKNTKFLQGDITKIKIPNADTLLLVHVLHHLHSWSEQEEIIKDCKKKLKKSGQLIIIEVEPKISLKYFVTWFVDHYLVPWLFESRFY